MIALDADVISLVLQGDPVCVARLAAVPAADQSLPVVVAAELFRGRLNVIRQAEAGRGRVALGRAFELFQLTLEGIRPLEILPYTDHADILFRNWRQQRIRIGTNDLRIAAVCVAHGATLATRNQRDFVHVPGLTLEIW